MDITAFQHMNIRMGGTRGKRPLRNLTPNDKVRAIQRIHNGETKASVSRDIGVPESTLRGWCKNEQKLRFMCRQLGDHMPLNGSDPPPEKRLKFVNNSSSLKLKGTAKNMEAIGHNGLRLSASDFAQNNGIEKMSIDEFIQTTNLMQEPTTTKSSQLPLAFNQPLISAEYSQLAMLQNFNLLTLLNPNLTTPTMSVPSQVEDCKPKIPSQVTSSAISNSSAETRSSPILSVKNWAKDPAKESLLIGITEGLRPNDSNDNNNNNDDNPTVPMGSTPLTETVFSPVFPNSLTPPIPSLFKDSESSNVALMDWCKLFNASLHYLALSAAAAALQQPGAAGFGSNGEIMQKDGRERSPDYILYRHLTKNLFPLPGNYLAGSDASNDSYFDSEPEDLSVPSTSSKISSPMNSSRSQSPNILSASSVHSDFE